MAFLLGAGLGANDVSNTFGTSVGSGVVTIIQNGYFILAYYLLKYSSLSELSCYIDEHEITFQGWSVTDTMRKGVVDLTEYYNNPRELMLGQVAILGHVTENKIEAMIIAVASWFLSPALSGLISGVLYLIVDIAVLRRNHPFECGLRSLPVFYFVVIAFNVLMVTWDGSKLLHFDRIPFWGAVLISIGIASIAALLVQFLVKPRLWRKIQGKSPSNLMMF
ncbi:phosphate transporter family protein [Cooperia oncophora]